MNKKQKIGLITGLSVGIPVLLGAAIGTTYVLAKANEAVINFKAIPYVVDYYVGDHINPNDFLVTKTVKGVETDITSECTFSPALDKELEYVDTEVSITYQGVTKKSKLNMMSNSKTLEEDQDTYYRCLDKSWLTIRTITQQNEKFRFLRDDINVKGKYAGKELMINDLEEKSVDDGYVTRYTLKLQNKDAKSEENQISIDLCGGVLFGGDIPGYVASSKDTLNQFIALQDSQYKIKLIGKGGEDRGQRLLESSFCNFAFVNSETNEQIANFQFNSFGVLSHLYIKEGVQLKYKPEGKTQSENFLTDKGVDLHFIYNNIRKF